MPINTEIGQVGEAGRWIHLHEGREVLIGTRQLASGTNAVLYHE